MKKILTRAEKFLRPKLAFIKWMNKEVPLMFLLLMWGGFFVLTIPFVVLIWTGVIGADDFNVWLSILALLTTMILSIVVVL